MPSNKKGYNREGWLEESVNLLRENVFTPAGHDVPEVRIACGWPSERGLSTKNKRIGECWHADTSEDKIPQIFISPWSKDGVEILGVVVHELVHAMGVSGHKKDFKKVATSVGLEGKMTATSVGEELEEELKKIVKKLGDYPHAAITSRRKEPQKTNLLKAVCVNDDCETDDRGGHYVVRVTAKWADKAPPICGLCQEDLEVEYK